MRIRIIWISLVFTLVAAAGWAVSPATQGAAPGEWTQDLDAAKALSAESSLPLLLNFTGSDWCGWCKLMDRQVFSQPAWQAWARNHLVLAWIDFPRDKTLVPEAFADRNQRLSKEFGVEGFPTFILLDPDGQTRLGEAGASRDVTPESFIATLEGLLLTSGKSVDALRAKMSDEQKTALDAAQSAFDLAQQKLEDWIKTNPPRTEENTAAFEAMNQDIDRTRQAYLELLKAAAAPPPSEIVSE